MKILIFIFITLLSVISTQLFGQNPKIDSLNKVIATTKVDTVKGRTLCRLSSELRKMGELENALKKVLEGLKIVERVKDEEGAAICLTNIGLLYLNQAAYSKAFEYFQKSLKISEKLGSQIGIYKCLSNIGVIYDEQGNYDKALDYYQKSLKISEKIGSQYGNAPILGNIGSIYLGQRNYNKALDYYQKSLNMFEKTGNQQAIANSLINLGTIYTGQRNYAKALDYYQKSLQMFDLIDDQEGVSHSLIDIGQVYIGLNKPILARRNIEKGLKIAQEIKHLEVMKIGSDNLSSADSALGDYKSAYEHYKLFKQYSDSLHNDEKSKEFGRIESKFQFEKEAEAEKRKQEEQAKIEAEKQERRNNLQYLTIFVTLISLFAGLVFMGKLNIPVKVMDIALFAGLLILFEFLLILFDPLFEKYSGGIPLYKLGFNSIVAFLFSPLHSWIEGKLRKRLVK